MAITRVPTKPTKPTRQRTPVQAAVVPKPEIVNEEMRAQATVVQANKTTTRTRVVTALRGMSAQMTAALGKLKSKPKDDAESRVARGQQPVQSGLGGPAARPASSKAAAAAVVSAKAGSGEASAQSSSAGGGSKGAAGSTASATAGSAASATAGSAASATPTVKGNATNAVTSGKAAVVSGANAKGGTAPIASAGKAAIASGGKAAIASGGKAAIASGGKAAIASGGKAKPSAATKAEAQTALASSTIAKGNNGKLPSIVRNKASDAGAAKAEAVAVTTPQVKAQDVAELRLGDFGLGSRGAMQGEGTSASEASAASAGEGEGIAGQEGAGQGAEAAGTKAAAHGEASSSAGAKSVLVELGKAASADIAQAHEADPEMALDSLAAEATLASAPEVAKRAEEHAAQQAAISQDAGEAGAVAFGLAAVDDAFIDQDADGNASSGDEEDDDDDTRGHATLDEGEHEEGHYEIPSLLEQYQKSLASIEGSTDGKGAMHYTWDVVFFRPGVYGARQSAEPILHVVVDQATAFDPAWAEAESELRKRFLRFEPDAVSEVGDFRAALRRARARAMQP